MLKEHIESIKKWLATRLRRSFLFLGDEIFLDWSPPSGHYRVWFCKPKTGSDKGFSTKFDLYKIFEGKWESIRIGHQLIYLGDKRILSWNMDTGDYRIWKCDPRIWQHRGRPLRVDPLPEPPVFKGSWKTIRSGHQLIYLGNERILDWDMDTGDYRIWKCDPRIWQHRGGPLRVDPLPEPPIFKGNWKTIRNLHKLIYLGNERILDWDMDTGDYRIWKCDPRIWQHRGGPLRVDPLPVPPVFKGNWRTIRFENQLAYFGENRMFDCELNTGNYRIWRCDPKIWKYSGNTLGKDPLPEPPVFKDKFELFASL